MESKSDAPKLGTGINFYVIAAIFIAILIYSVGNALEPDDASSIDPFEVILTAGFGVASIFSFIVAKRYWGSHVFGRAYFSLGLAYAAYFAGWILWYVYQVSYQVENPYPYYPDIGYFAFYPLAIYHIRTNMHYFKPKLSLKQKFTIISIPIGITIVYAFFGFFPVGELHGISTLSIQSIPAYDAGFYKEYATGIAYMLATTSVFSFAIVGAQVFRGTVLGNAWGLLLVGFGLNTFGDVRYYFLELFGTFDRADIATPLWVAGTIVVCYALYKHRDI